MFHYFYINYSVEFSSSYTSLSLVTVSPLLNVSADKVAIDTNQSAMLECRCQSVPAATYIWYNGSTEIQTGGRVHIQDSLVPGVYPYVSRLRIDDVQTADLGNYTCEASNYLGSGSSSIELTVKSE